MAEARRAARSPGVTTVISSFVVMTCRGGANPKVPRTRGDSTITIRCGVQIVDASAPVRRSHHAGVHVREHVLSGWRDANSPTGEDYKPLLESKSILSWSGRNLAWRTPAPPNGCFPPIIDGADLGWLHTLATAAGNTAQCSGVLRSL